MTDIKEIDISLIRDDNIQSGIIKSLSALIQKRTIPHALLFTGIEGVGKQGVALIFAMMCNCGEVRAGQGTGALYPCGVCRSCRKITSGNHPDISVIGPSGPYIRIDQIRELCHTLSMKPYEAISRVVIIAEAHTMNPEAGNALLKVLEEPPERTVLILTATQTSDLLPTIVSRCRHIRFDPISRETLEALLIKREDIAPEAATSLVAMANGSYSRAYEMSRSNWINRRIWLINELEFLLEISLSRSQGEKKPFPVARVLAYAERLSKNKDILSDSLEVMQIWLRDLIVCQLAMNSNQGYNPERIMNRDLKEKLLTYVKKLMTQTDPKISTDLMLSKIKAIQAVQKKLRRNANLRLTMDALVMQLAR